MTGDPRVATADINHLLLNCCMSSELGTGVRYAYTRLDIIDRKSSELFRSFSWIFGLLGGLTALGGTAFSWRQPGAPSPLQSVMLLGFVVLLLTLIGVTVIHKSITGLRYYRIGPDTMDAASRIGAAGLKLTAQDPCIAAYLAEMSAVTVRRERQLATMDRLHSLGLLISAILLVCLIAVGPRHAP